MSGTESLVDASVGSVFPPGRVSVLHLGLRCDDLKAEPLRLELDPAIELTLGRADGPLDVSEQRVSIPDRWLSTRHLSVRHSPSHGWQVRDLGSKNGTTVNGQLVSEAWLSDGDVVRAGACVFVFRADEPRAVAGAGGPALATDSPLRSSNADFSQQVARLARVATTSLPVLIRGETGTGKEVTARAVHELSGRPGPFVAVNCGAIAESLLEAQLFGAVKGAYTGASGATEGFVRAADGGTLFLDEIAELAPASQVALLRVLEERAVTPVGATTPVPVDFRLVAATHQPVAERIEAGQFREDLYARLRGFELELPPLRDRREDIGRLVRRFLPALEGEHGPSVGRPISLAPAAGETLVRYYWPHNVRGLRNALGAAVALSETGDIALDALPADVRTGEAIATATDEGRPGAPGPAGGTDESASEADSSAATGSTSGASLPEDMAARLRVLLARHRGNLAAVGRDLQTSRSQVRRLLVRYGLKAEDFRE